MQTVLATMREADVAVSAELGDPDPVQAAQDALLKAPADEILIFARDPALCDGLGASWDRMIAELDPPGREARPPGGRAAAEISSEPTRSSV